ncbi:MAG: heme-binding protein [Lautropia sp.]
MSITLKQAIAFVDRGICRAQALDLRLSFVVLDAFGQLVQLDRMDGASLMSPDIAEAKALTALNFMTSTREVAEMDRSTLDAIAATVAFRVMPVAGGIPLYAGEQLIGAIGVSGATPPEEDEVARYAAGDSARTGASGSEAR